MPLYDVAADLCTGLETLTARANGSMVIGGISAWLGSGTHDNS